MSPFCSVRSVIRSRKTPEELMTHRIVYGTHLNPLCTLLPWVEFFLPVWLVSSWIQTPSFWSSPPILLRICFLEGIILLVSTHLVFCFVLFYFVLFNPWFWNRGSQSSKFSQKGPPSGTFAGFMLKNYGPSSCTFLTKWINLTKDNLEH